MGPWGWGAGGALQRRGRTLEGPHGDRRVPQGAPQETQKAAPIRAELPLTGVGGTRGLGAWWRCCVCGPTLVSPQSPFPVCTCAGHVYTVSLSRWQPEQDSSLLAAPWEGPGVWARRTPHCTPSP